MPNQFGNFMRGLAKGFASQSPQGLKQKEREQEFDMETKKLELAKKLEMQLWQMKEEYARQNPRYTQFKQTPHGVVGFSEYGESKTFPNSPEDQAILDEERKQTGLLTGARIKQAEAAADASKENAASNSAYRKVMGEAAQKRAAHGAKVPAYSETSIYNKALANARSKYVKTIPKLSAMDKLDDEKSAAYDKAVEEAEAKAQEEAQQETEKEISRKRSDAGLLSGAGPSNPFMLAPPSTATNEEDDEDF